MTKFLAFISFLAALAMGAAWYSQRGMPGWGAVGTSGRSAAPDGWLDDLYSQNPKDVADATAELNRLGARAVPVVQATLSDPRADRERRKSALKACVVLEQTAAPAVREVAAQLTDPELTAEAALALSFMGPKAFEPLRAALSSDDPVLRQEALRSIGKLRTRAPLSVHAVVPLLIDGMLDEDTGVRVVAATYLGILNDDPAASVPALIQGLEDPEIEVRRASATALGSFEKGATPALAALRKAAGDRDPELAREAGRALLRIQGK